MTDISDKENIENTFQTEEESTYPSNNNIIYRKHVNNVTKRSFNYIILKEGVYPNKITNKKNSVGKFSNLFQKLYQKNVENITRLLEEPAFLGGRLSLQADGSDFPFGFYWIGKNELTVSLFFFCKFLLQTLIELAGSPSDFIRRVFSKWANKFPLWTLSDQFLWTFIRLGEDDEWMMDGKWWMVYIDDR
ncbi:hypothetical protein RhiirA4_461249 [Rhizophagus irregularis]|uniref:Uncharacterized protein n=1 Tax=Rhizophagus irregularis TaxID=588596 RepID=A0A2I1GIF8_9GLOM|nr:hypothetical protein RhiirA4_461249 [Rhizophagus irregularis]